MKRSASTPCCRPCGCTGPSDPSTGSTDRTPMPSTPPSPDELATRWRAAFGPVAPLGHHLRAALHERWVRIHSLPASKRYAETPAEVETMLARQNAVAYALFGDEASCWV